MLLEKDIVLGRDLNIFMEAEAEDLETEIEGAPPPDTDSALSGPVSYHSVSVTPTEPVASTIAIASTNLN